ncbi:hypothetical protein AXG93_3310s1030 [Marchantia polymorpha subsp. ruderalis]|uniref:FCP1 homology domain-containing protein n=1 Tax=Marchantia polymorpha subsp. ruderalis TaxID=1480154 RepID=A0A176W0V4_MARPO|nr:hypothetical protein AXG93_3310s1030 [Marchantia polymorpha subsp. ruderalis]
MRVAILKEPSGKKVMFSCGCLGEDESGLRMPKVLPRLPPMRAEHEGKMTLVLDLDETLVHSSLDPSPAYDYSIEVEMKSRMRQTFFVLKRPGVDDFLAAVASKFEVVLFTASTKGYADAVLDVLDPGGRISHRLYQDSCSVLRGIIIKDLSLLGRQLSKVLIVDNNPQSYMLQPANAVPISSFRDDLQDLELVEVFLDLEMIATAGNVAID